MLFRSETSKYIPPLSKSLRVFPVGWAVRIVVSVSGMGATPLIAFAVAPDFAPNCPRLSMDRAGHPWTKHADKSHILLNIGDASGFRWKVFW